eukprot:CAMPEP_0119548300 /NCGR_PEP_ID=MMETSP1352-20130426/2241_1 /TAXON_ID=265584 /ORGANISM="Stauroneis constricta, Strain CCMP1120" /LENGTH=852 /DNA_ID=CAMNT_0007593523 /DNA_START=60 /DNA_END=2618 /DNA_ORIENTATION=+
MSAQEKKDGGSLDGGSSLAGGSSQAESDVSGSQKNGNKRASLITERQKILNTSVNRRILGVRVAVFGFLLLSTLAVSLAVYFYLRNIGKKDFDDTFDAQAVRILELFHQSVAERLQAIDSLSTMITTLALNTGSTFPNVTIPNFEMLGCNFRIVSGATFVSFSVLVTDDQRAGWNAYAQQNQNFYFPSLAADTEQRIMQDERLGYDTNASSIDLFQRNLGQEDADAIPSATFKEEADGAASADSQHHRSLQQGGEQNPLYTQFAPFIYNLEGTTMQIPEPGSGPYMPVWHNSPVIPIAGLLKQNVLDQPAIAEPIKTVLATKEAVIAGVDGIGGDTQADEVGVSIFQYFLQVGQYRHDQEEFVVDPVSTFHYPVFNNFSEAREIAGLLSTDIYWKLHFKASLNDELKGIICVIENTRNQTFSFKLTPDDVIYVGSEDRHDSDFDDMMFEADMAEYLNSTKSAATQSYTSVGFNHAYANYKIRVYPTSEMKDEYITSEPIIYTVAIIVVFLFTSSVFILYDCLVERRQRIVMDRAMKSGAVVSSLFPETVQDRLYNAQGASHEKDEDDPHNNDAGIRNKANLLNNSIMTITRRSVNDVSALHQNGSPHGLSTAPIADKFENATILFADLVEFTKWSSARQPEEVFHFLETVYGNFDRLARRKHVFKVETIGDCYLAATGLPTPQPDHATIMCQFAHACMKSLHATLEQLSETLGAEVMDLGLRIGIHSGEVTAGVLRGEKSRFQVFGDTVNTASRMESSCETNKIQCSQTVADELILNGHMHWLKSREGLVNVKGKGEMQTYFLKVDDVFGSNSRGSNSINKAEDTNPQSPTGGLEDGKSHSSTGTGSERTRD